MGRERLKCVQDEQLVPGAQAVNEASRRREETHEILQMACWSQVWWRFSHETRFGLESTCHCGFVGPVGVNQLATAGTNATLLNHAYQGGCLIVITPDYVHVMAAGRILRTARRSWPMAGTRRRRYGLGSRAGSWPLAGGGLDGVRRTVHRDRAAQRWLPIAWLTEFLGATARLRA